MIVDCGRLAVIYHLTGVHLDGDAGKLHAFADLGVRSIHTPFDTTVDARPRAWQRGPGDSAVRCSQLPSRCGSLR